MLKYLYAAIALATLGVRALTIYENIQRQQKKPEKVKKKREFTFEDFPEDDERPIN